jgi:hypothetical protein
MNVASTPYRVWPIIFHAKVCFPTSLSRNISLTFTHTVQHCYQNLPHNCLRYRFSVVVDLLMIIRLLGSISTGENLRLSSSTLKHSSLSDIISVSQLHLPCPVCLSHDISLIIHLLLTKHPERRPQRVSEVMGESGPGQTRDVEVVYLSTQNHSPRVSMFSKG